MYDLLITGGLVVDGNGVPGRLADVAVTDGGLEILGHVSMPCNVREGPDVVLDHVLDLLGKLRGQGLVEEIHGAGIGVPGPVSFREGVPVARYAPQTKPEDLEAPVGKLL